MTATISESYVSRPFTVGLKNNARELVYDIIGTHDEAVVESLLNSTAPATYSGLVLDSIEAEPIHSDSATSQGVWKGKARYVSPEVEYTFDTGGGTQHITQSYGTVNSYAPGGLTPPDFAGAIGVSEDAVDGVDVPSPKFDFTETHTFDGSAVTTSYKLALFNLTGKKNNASFKGFAAGECLFLGATGSSRGSGQWSITFRFSGSPNVSGLSVGGITGISKLGWQYLWLRYASYADTTAFSLVKRPIAAYVEEVILDGDFSLLGIGV
jgi:hypothetical protein